MPYNALTRKSPRFPRLFRVPGVFAPLVGALVFKTSGGFEQSSLWVRFPYTPDFLSPERATRRADTPGGPTSARAVPVSWDGRGVSARREFGPAPRKRRAGVTYRRAI